MSVLPELSLGSMSGYQRARVAAGFALLQLQRGQVVVAPEDLSTAPEWQIKAYQLLKMLLPMTTSAVTPEALDFTVFHYFLDESVVSTVAACCVVSSNCVAGG